MTPTPAPYPYERWRRVRQGEIDASLRALQLARALTPRLYEALDALGGALGAPLGGRVRLMAHRQTTAEAAAATAADPCAVVRVCLVGQDAPILVEVDVPFALWLVDRALGGTSTPPLTLRRPNVAERAVLALLSARVLCEAQPGAEPRLRIGGVAAEAAAVRVALRSARGGGDGERPVHVFELAIGGEAGSPTGVLRVLVPEAVLERAPPLAASSPAPAALARLDRLDVRVRLSAQAGRTRLDPGEAAGIETGDVVLLDEATAAPGPGGVVGVVGLRFPRGRRPRIWCRLDGGRLTVEDIDRTEEVPMQSSTKGNESGALLAEVPVEVVVVMGRVDLSAREAIELTPGDTLVLERRPGDPVELRAGDRLLGRGELVEVEGKIGVQVLEVVR